MTVEEIAKEKGIKTAQEVLDAQENQIRAARIQYLRLLKFGLKDWRRLSDEEEKRIASLDRAIDKYLDHLASEFK